MTPRKPGKRDQDPERRRHQGLRETVQELLDHIRATASAAREMSDAELEYAQQRLEWLADEVWRTCLESEAADEPPPA